MILTDTGPLVAILDKDDPYHTSCIEAASQLPSDALLSSWPCFTEAMYLLHAAGGWRYQNELWNIQQSGKLLLHDPTPPEIERMAGLMATYADQPMDLADASLLVAAEHFGLTRVFTLDSQFRIYRLRNGSVLDVVPNNPVGR